MLFIAIGQIFEMIIPKELVVNLFSSNNPYSIPLAAIFGLLVYISSDLAFIKYFFLAIGAGESSVLTFIIKDQGRTWL